MLLETTERKSVQFSDSVEVKKIEGPSSPDPNEPVEIDEVKIDRLISLLHEANPEDSSTDSQEMLYLEGEISSFNCFHYLLFVYQHVNAIKMDVNIK